MERESFEDMEVAEALNRDFVAIKVDREERPDIDAVYMQVCQTLTGGGGWPLTVFLLPDKTAFYAGTYFPKVARSGAPGLLDILGTVQKLWKTDRQKLLQQGEDLKNMLRTTEAPVLDSLKKADFHGVFTTLRQIFDRKNGGFGRAPKFPSPHMLMFLLRYAYFERQEEAREMVLLTLKQMIRGGIFDQIGFGFSRYSTDERWLVPHFEKMLYDNALLTMVLLETYQATGDGLCKRAAEKTLTYVLREMTDETGAFYSAQDADSEGEEGKYYTLRPEETIALLGQEDGAYVNKIFGITEAGNFEGATIPNLLDNAAYEQPDNRLAPLLEKIDAFRKGRTTLFKDTKCLTGWNALMMGAFAKAYGVLGSETYRVAAERAANFLSTTLRDQEGRLAVRYSGGETAGNGYLEDYAYMAWAFLTLFEVTFDPKHLETALTTAETMVTLFEDRDGGGYYLTGEDAEALMVRPKETYDGAVPSGNSVAAFVLGRLSRLTGDPLWAERAAQQQAFMAGAIKSIPAGHCFGLISAMEQLYTQRELICTLPTERDAVQLREAMAPHFFPDTVLLVKTPENGAVLTRLVPQLEAYLVLEGQTNYYICENKTCALPKESLAALMEALTPQKS